MHDIVHSHQGNSAQGTGRLVLLQNSLPEPSEWLCRLPEKVLLLQINWCRLLSRAFLMQINRALLRKSSAGSPANGFLMQNKASGLSAFLLACWEKSAGASRRQPGLRQRASGILDRVLVLSDKGHKVPNE